MNDIFQHSGADLIAIERQRQIEKEGFTAEHDAEHGNGELVRAAICYAAPERIYVAEPHATGIHYQDPWPWDAAWDKRLEYGERRSNPGNVPADPKTYTFADRVDSLVKAGALIAAEIDRLRRSRFVFSTASEQEECSQNVFGSNK